MTRRHAHLAVFAASLATFAGSVAPAQSDDPAATQVLPDLRQSLPSDVKVALIGGTWRLGFASEVVNDGPGYLKITGNGPGDGPMVADQVVQMSDGTTSTIPAIGEMHYVIGGGHEHWHLLDFERYELRSTADSSQTIVKDQKTGFCMANAFTSDNCGRNHPEYTTISEGIAVGGGDTYLGYLEGQYLTLDPATTPAGDYLLVNRVNPTNALLDADPADNMATLRLALRWDSAGKPTATITNSCAGSIDCPAPPAPLPGPEPEPQTTPQPVIPTAEPQQVPTVPAADFAPPTAAASMSRSMAGRLVRRAIVKSLKQTPRSLRTTCARRGSLGFACSSSWRGRGKTRWSGRVRVWYRVSGSALGWYYDLSAIRRPGGQRVVTRAARGSASRAVFSGPSGSLFCAVRED